MPNAGKWTRRNSSGLNLEEIPHAVSLPFSSRRMQLPSPSAAARVLIGQCKYSRPPELNTIPGWSHVTSEQWLVLEPI
jgi:hypothetical protein